MENKKLILVMVALSFAAIQAFAQAKKNVPSHAGTEKKYFLDVHQLTPGKVKMQDVAKAHAKDLATEKKFGADFIKYWVSEEDGLVYCLSSAKDSNAIRETHAEAHGLLPEHIYEVTSGEASKLKRKKSLFMDVHYLGAGKVTREAVAEAHKKDLAVQDKYGANFVNYWVDEKNGIVMCLVQAKDSAALVRTHSEAHGLIPSKVVRVREGK